MSTLTITEVSLPNTINFRESARLGLDIARNHFVQTESKLYQLSLAVVWKTQRSVLQRGNKQAANLSRNFHLESSTLLL